MNYFCFFDLETSSVDTDTAQILSMGAVMVDPMRLEIVPDSEFYTLVKPEVPEIVDNWEFTGLNLADCQKGPKCKDAIRMFEEYIQRYKKGKTGWDAPSASGFNIVGYDLPVLTRLGMKVETYFHKTNRFDLMDDFFRWTFFSKDYHVTSLKEAREKCGLSNDGAHNALCDARDAALIGIRFLKMYRKNNVKFEGAFND